MFDRDFEDAMRDWLNELQRWLDGEFETRRKDYSDYTHPYRAFFDWHGAPPDPAYHRPSWKPEDATWYQVYETVSEGTPVTPPFATQAEVVDYLVNVGEEGKAQYRHSREAAEAFVYGSSWVPSITVVNGTVLMGIDAAPELKRKT